MKGAREIWILGLLLYTIASSGTACPDFCKCDSGFVKCQNVDVKSSAQTCAEDMHFLKKKDVSELQSLKQVEYLDMSRCNLTAVQIPLVELSNLKVLDARWASLKTLGTLGFYKLTNFHSLQKISVMDNLLVTLSDGEFRYLPNLTELTLSNNKIFEIHQNAFMGLTDLKILDLSCNEISNLHEETFESLKSLESLGLRSNQLKVINLKLFKSLLKLEKLDLRNNKLTEVSPSTLEPLPYLTELKISDNPLKEKDITMLSAMGIHLKVIEASKTGLTKIPGELTRSIRNLILNDNNITLISCGDLDSYPLLEELYLSVNKIATIEDDALGRLDYLQNLVISNNGLQDIPSSLPKNLKMLDMDRNNVKTIKASDFQGFVNLEELSLRRNLISVIEEGSFSQLPNLTYLALSYNPIQKLPPNILSGSLNLHQLELKSLMSLDVEKNQNKDTAFPIRNLERLEKLQLSSSPVLANQLLNDNAAISACKSLQMLDLSETNITSIPSKLTHIISGLNSLWLCGNEWNCTSDQYWLAQWIKQSKEIVGSRPLDRYVCSPICKEPTHFQGKALERITELMAVPNVTTIHKTLYLSATPVLTAEISYIFNTSNNSVAMLLNSSKPVKKSTATDSLNLTIGSIPPQQFSGSKKEPIEIEEESAERTTQFSIKTEFESKTEVPAIKIQAYNIKELKEANIKDVKTEFKNGESNLEKNVRNISGATIVDSIKHLPVNNEQNIMARTELTEESSKPNVDVQDRYLTQQGTKVVETNENFEEVTMVSRSKLLSQEVSSDYNTFAEELNSQITDSDAQLADSLSSGAHPGMIIMLGAAFSATVSMIIILLRRVTTKRVMDQQYQRQENVEVQAFTLTLDLW